MNVGLENVRMRMLLGAAEKMSPISSVMMAMVSTLRGGIKFVGIYVSWVGSFGRCSKWRMPMAEVDAKARYPRYLNHSHILISAVLPLQFLHLWGIVIMLNLTIHSLSAEICMKRLEIGVGANDDGGRSR